MASATSQVQGVVDVLPVMCTGLPNFFKANGVGIPGSYFPKPALPKRGKGCMGNRVLARGMCGR